MSRWGRNALFLGLFLGGGLGAEPSYWDYHPLRLGGKGIHLFKASIEGEQGDLSYGKREIYTSLLVPLSRTHFLFPRVGYRATYFSWEDNPKFKGKRFNFWDWGLMWYSTALPDWQWIFRLDYSLDAEHMSEPSLYGLGTALLWGAHQFHPQWHYHIGFLGYTGMESTILYPIIGVDYSPSKRWTIKGIFPLEYGVQYHWSKIATLALKARSLKDRFRVARHETEPRAIVGYSSAGIEWNLQCVWERKLEIELYAGYNLGCSFYIKNASGDHPLYASLGATPYLGAALEYGF